MTCKATLVPDIRRHQFLPGAVQFDRHSRSQFYSCPCGCGAISEVIGCWATRDPLGFYRWKGADGSNGPGEPMKLAIIIEEGGKVVVHWRGTLQNGEFIDEQGVADDGRTELGREQAPENS